MNLVNKLFADSPAIRYVALYRGGELASRQRDDAEGAASSESDRYEDLLVNPTLLKLVRLSGENDCGRAQFVVVRYGNLYQLVIDLPDGHVSVCFELGSNPLDHAQTIRGLCEAG